LNEIAKATNETFTGLSACFRGSEYILYEIPSLKAYNPLPRPLKLGFQTKHILNP